MNANTPEIFSVESVNYALKAIGFPDVEIFDDPRHDGRITMISRVWNAFDEECHVFCPTNCMNPQEWLERFTNGGWRDIMPRAWTRSRPLKRKRQPAMRYNG